MFHLSLQEYLAYQRQIALQRMQEQEAARQARLEQHKQFIMQRAMQPAMYVQGYNTQVCSLKKLSLFFGMECLSYRN